LSCLHCCCLQCLQYFGCFQFHIQSDSCTSCEGNFLLIFSLRFCVRWTEQESELSADPKRDSFVV
jgi:hypothetical protein